MVLKAKIALTSRVERCAFPPLRREKVARMGHGRLVVSRTRKGIRTSGLRPGGPARRANRVLAEQFANCIAVPIGSLGPAVSFEQIGGLGWGESSDGAEDKNGPQHGGQAFKPDSHTVAVGAGDHSFELFAGDTGRIQVVILNACHGVFEALRGGQICGIAGGDRVQAAAHRARRLLLRAINGSSQAETSALATAVSTSRMLSSPAPTSMDARL